MAKYKNISGEPLWTTDTAGRQVRVDPDTVADLPDDVYVQVGDHGEPALYERVATPKTTSKKES